MRTFVLAFLLAAALPSGRALARQGSEAAAAEAARRADAAVLRHSASILGVPVDKLRLERSYAHQVVAGDALDVSVGASGLEDIAERLTIARLQQVVRNVLARRPGKSFKPKPPGGSAPPRR